MSEHTPFDVVALCEALERIHVYPIEEQIAIGRQAASLLRRTNAPRRQDTHLAHPIRQQA